MTTHSTEPRAETILTAIGLLLIPAVVLLGLAFVVAVSVVA